jgi:hypothetical protein
MTDNYTTYNCIEEVALASESISTCDNIQTEYRRSQCRKKYEKTHPGSVGALDKARFQVEDKISETIWGMLSKQTDE